MVCESCLSSSWLWAAAIVALGVFLWKYLTRNFGYFKDRGIPAEDAVPIIGSMAPIMFQKIAIHEWLQQLSQKYSKHKYFGLHDANGIRWVIQDPDLIRQVGIKDFDHFVNHEIFGSSEPDALFLNSLFNLEGQKWKDMRSTLSPCFTGSKMRMMFELVNETGQEFVQYFLDQHKNGQQPLHVDVKDVVSKFAVDIISTCAFGLKTNSFTDPTNPVYVNSKKAFDYTNPALQVKFMLIGVFPKLMNFLNIGFTPAETKNFFHNLVMDTMNHRKSTKTFRPDIIQSLMQAREGQLKHEEETPVASEGFAVVGESEIGKRKVTRQWTDIEISSQAFLFFVAGFDTTSTSLQFTCYELALNKEIQDKLLAEVDGVLAELQGKPITYERLLKMEYLDAVFSETLRKYPPAFELDRVCEKNTIIEDYDGKKAQIEKGHKIWINVYGLHYNHKYFPNPDRFDPERFLGANKQKIQPNTYLPFGIGPRNCIGSRFALMQVKSLLFHIFSKFTLEVCDETLIPMRFQKTFGIAPERKIIVEFRPRKL